jgi:hypothetical protein
MHRQASRIIAKFGGARRLAYVCGMEPSRVYKWTYPKAKGGTGGIIPSACVSAVQVAAETAGIELKAEDWLP